jgi:hypothetical protein
MKRITQERGTDELKELHDIKRLLVLQLLSQGVQANAIADLLEMDRGDFSRAFPMRKLLAKKKVNRRVKRKRRQR